MNSYRQLRYPIPQCFAFMSILIISFCIYGIYYSKSHIYVPYYLLVTTAIELFLFYYHSSVCFINHIIKIS